MQFGKISVILDEMKICAVCCDIFGKIGLSGDPKDLYQPCECQGKTAPPWAEGGLMKYLNLDFNQIVTLCCGCGQEVIRSGSMWSPFFCEYCLRFTRTYYLKDPPPSWWYPIGRHPLLNGFWLGGLSALNAQNIEPFGRDTESLQERIELLGRRRKVVVSRNLKYAGLPSDEDIELKVYLAVVPRESGAKDAELLGLRGFFHEKYDYVLEAEKTVAAWEREGRQRCVHDRQVTEDQIQYTPEKEIPCVFYALIIRNQALERKYAGGLKGFLKLHGGIYNDEITTLCYMAPEFYFDEVDLESNGLEAGKDFVEFADDIYRHPSYGRNKEPYPFDVPWLGGYYQDGGVMVFMIN